MNYCDHCHGDGWRITNIGNKPVKCDECCGTGHTAYTIPKVNGWNLWRVLEFIAAVIVLVVVGVIIAPSFLYNAVKDRRWILKSVKR